jgi:hypothetical protein
LVRFDIFDAGRDLYESGEVLFVDVTERAVRFIVKGKNVRMEVTPTGTKFFCNCEHHIQHQLQDKFCSRVIAVVIYICHKRGLFKLKAQRRQRDEKA